MHCVFSQGCKGGNLLGYRHQQVQLELSEDVMKTNALYATLALGALFS